MNLQRTTSLLAIALSFTLSAALSAQVVKIAEFDEEGAEDEAEPAATVLGEPKERKSFAALDSDGDGSVDTEEFGGSDEEFENFDFDGDGFISSSEFDDGVSEEHIGWLEVYLELFSAALRTHLVRHGKFPEDLRVLTADGLVRYYENDPWGTPYRWTLEGQQTLEEQIEKELPSNFKDLPEAVQKQIRKNLRNNLRQQQQNPTQLLQNYEVRSAGADQIFGNDDDVVRKDTLMSKPLTESRRRQIIAGAGENYRMAREAWSYELAYRLWLCVCEQEVLLDDNVGSIGDVMLPSSLFPNGEAVDVFGRRFQLRKVRGLRAIIAKSAVSDDESFSMSESEFVHHFEKRATSFENGYSYNLRERLPSLVMNFVYNNGRLPLTMSEIRQSNPNMWFFRSGDADRMTYFTIAGDQNFVLADLGRDGKPGGRDLDADTVVYEDNFRASDRIGRRGSNFGSDAAARRTQLLYNRVLTIAKERADAEDGEADEDAPRMKLLEQDTLNRILEAAEKAEAEQAKSETSNGNADPGATSSGSDQGKAENNASDNREPADESHNKNTADDVISTLAASSSTNVTLSLQEVPEEREIVEEPVKDGTTEENVADNAKVDNSSELGHELKLVPNLLYHKNDAELKGFFSMRSWEADNYVRQVQTLSRALYIYARQMGAKSKRPCGNVDLSNAEDLRSIAGNSNVDWWQSQHYDENQVFQAFIVTRFEVDERKNLSNAVCIGIPADDVRYPITVIATIGGHTMQPLFAQLADQPDGWLEMALAYDGQPPSDGATDKSGSEKSSDEGDNSKSDAGASPDAEPAGKSDKPEEPMKENADSKALAGAADRESE